MQGGWRAGVLVGNITDAFVPGRAWHFDCNCGGEVPFPGLTNTGMPLQEALLKRREELQAWLKENGRECWREQSHLQEGSAEQIYWHFGYLAALQDMLTQLGKE